MPSVTVELLQAQNRKLREENEGLRETVRQLREGRLAADTLPDWLPHLSMKERAVMRMLAAGRIVSVERIFDYFYGDRADPPSPDLPRIWICKLRHKVAPFGIEIRCIWGQGYQITPASRDLLAAKSAEAA